MARGFEVAAAHDGRAAIATITRDPRQFAVIITDLHLPGTDGFEVLEAFREANPSVYVVMITGYASIDSALRAVREGAHDHLAKPFALGQLEVVLTRISRSHGARAGKSRALETRWRMRGRSRPTSYPMASPDGRRTARPH